MNDVLDLNTFYEVVELLSLKNEENLHIWLSYNFCSFKLY